MTISADVMECVLPCGSAARILVIDDNISVLDAFRKILAPPDSLTEELTELETALFGAAGGRSPSRPTFLVDLVASGKSGRDNVIQACAEGRPYAVAFVDMRMPDWDGLQTIEALWQADPDLQVVICTAYSDYTWDQIVDRLGRADRWMILKKPLDMIEILQAAVTLADRWRLLHEQRRLVDALERQVEARGTELRRVNRTLRMISRCNDALVRSLSEGDLLETVCRRIIEDGDYALVWIGFAADDGKTTIVPVANAGTDDGYLDFLRLTWDADGQRCCLVGRAIHDVQPAVSRHIAADPMFARWRDEALRRGFASAVALPLRTKTEVFGNLSIYSSVVDAFDDEEVRLLQELADDIAYGIASLRAERRLEYQANYDILTGLPNRSLFRDRLQQAIAHAARAERQVAVILLSLDRFQSIRSALGEEAGGVLLKAFGDRLSSRLRAGDSVAHLLGEEFAIAVTDLGSADDVTGIVWKLMQAIAETLQVAGHEVYMTSSAGISLSSTDGDDADTLLRNAAAALHFAKTEGGNTFRFYASDMNARASARLAIETDLRRAMEAQEMLLHYQPKVSMRNGELTGAEALIRWQHPRFGMIPPSDFIPHAEESGLILPLGEWVITEVCRQIRCWTDAGVPVLPVAINVSARQFRQKNLSSILSRALQSNQVDPKLIELEITESALMQDLDTGAAVLRELKETGVQLTLDDFGTGYSSLSYLQRFPVDCVKIDQSFVRELAVNPGDAAICRAVIELAHALQLRVTGEGVETDAQVSYLRRHRCDDLQGYYFSRPMPADEFRAMLHHRHVFSLPVTGGVHDRTLLVVDDEPNILSAIRRLCRREGFRVLTADNARAGLELLAEQEVQIVLSDQRMPNMSGTEFLAQVRLLYPDTIRLVLSGYTDIETVIDAVNRGTLFKFLTKPWDDEALLAQLHEAFVYYELRTRTVSPTGFHTFKTPHS